MLAEDSSLVLFLNHCNLASQTLKMGELMYKKLESKYELLLILLTYKCSNDLLGTMDLG